MKEYDILRATLELAAERSEAIYKAQKNPREDWIPFDQLHSALKVISKKLKAPYALESRCYELLLLMSAESEKNYTWWEKINRLPFYIQRLSTVNLFSSKTEGLNIFDRLPDPPPYPLVHLLKDAKVKFFPHVSSTSPSVYREGEELSVLLNHNHNNKGSIGNKSYQSDYIADRSYSSLNLSQNKSPTEKTKPSNTNYQLNVSSSNYSTIGYSKDVQDGVVFSPSSSDFPSYTPYSNFKIDLSSAEKLRKEYEEEKGRRGTSLSDFASPVPAPPPPAPSLAPVPLDFGEGAMEEVKSDPPPYSPIPNTTPLHVTFAPSPSLDSPPAPAGPPIASGSLSYSPASSPSSPTSASSLSRGVSNFSLSLRKSKVMKKYLPPALSSALSSSLPPSFSSPPLSSSPPLTEPLSEGKEERAMEGKGKRERREEEKASSPLYYPPILSPKTNGGLMPPTRFPSPPPSSSPRQGLDKEAHLSLLLEEMKERGDPLDIPLALSLLKLLSLFQRYILSPLSPLSPFSPFSSPDSTPLPLLFHSHLASLPPLSPLFPWEMWLRGRINTFIAKETKNAFFLRWGQATGNQRKGREYYRVKLLRNVFVSWGVRRVGLQMRRTTPLEVYATRRYRGEREGEVLRYAVQASHSSPFLSLAPLPVRHLIANAQGVYKAYRGREARSGVTRGAKENKGYYLAQGLVSLFFQFQRLHRRTVIRKRYHLLHSKYEQKIISFHLKKMKLYYKSLLRMNNHNLEKAELTYYRTLEKKKLPHAFAILIENAKLSQIERKQLLQMREVILSRPACIRALYFLKLKSYVRCFFHWKSAAEQTGFLLPLTRLLAINAFAKRGKKRGLGKWRQVCEKRGGYRKKGLEKRDGNLNPKLPLSTRSQASLSKLPVSRPSLSLAAPPLLSSPFFSREMMKREGERVGMRRALRRLHFLSLRPRLCSSLLELQVLSHPPRGVEAKRGGGSLSSLLSSPLHREKVKGREHLLLFSKERGGWVLLPMPSLLGEGREKEDRRNREDREERLFSLLEKCRELTRIHSNPMHSSPTPLTLDRYLSLVEGKSQSPSSLSPTPSLPVPLLKLSLRRWYERAQRHLSLSSLVSSLSTRRLGKLLRCVWGEWRDAYTTSFHYRVRRLSFSLRSWRQLQRASLLQQRGERRVSTHLVKNAFKSWGEGARSRDQYRIFHACALNNLLLDSLSPRLLYFALHSPPSLCPSLLKAFLSSSPSYRFPSPEPSLFSLSKNRREKDTFLLHIKLKNKSHVLSPSEFLRLIFQTRNAFATLGRVFSRLRSSSLRAHSNKGIFRYLSLSRLKNAFFRLRRHRYFGKLRRRIRMQRLRVRLLLWKRVFVANRHRLFTLRPLMRGWHLLRARLVYQRVYDKAWGGKMKGAWGRWQGYLSLLDHQQQSTQRIRNTHLRRRVFSQWLSLFRASRHLSARARRLALRRLGIHAQTQQYLRDGIFRADFQFRKLKMREWMEKLWEGGRRRSGWEREGGVMERGEVEERAERREVMRRRERNEEQEREERRQVAGTEEQRAEARREERGVSPYRLAQSLPPSALPPFSPPPRASFPPSLPPSLSSSLPLSAAKSAQKRSSVTWEGETSPLPRERERERALPPYSSPSAHPTPHRPSLSPLLSRSHVPSSTSPTRERETERAPHVPPHAPPSSGPSHSRLSSPSPASLRGREREGEREGSSLPYTSPYAPPTPHHPTATPLPSNSRAPSPSTSRERKRDGAPYPTSAPSQSRLSSPSPTREREREGTLPPPFYSSSLPPHSLPPSSSPYPYSRERGQTPLPSRSSPQRREREPQSNPPTPMVRSQGREGREKTLLPFSPTHIKRVERGEPAPSPLYVSTSSSPVSHPYAPPFFPPPSYLSSPSPLPPLALSTSLPLLSSAPSPLVFASFPKRRVLLRLREMVRARQQVSLSAEYNYYLARGRFFRKWREGVDQVIAVRGVYRGLTCRAFLRRWVNFSNHLRSRNNIKEFTNKFSIIIVAKRALRRWRKWGKRRGGRQGAEERGEKWHGERGQGKALHKLISELSNSELRNSLNYQDLFSPSPAHGTNPYSVDTQNNYYAQARRREALGGDEGGHESRGRRRREESLLHRGALTSHVRAQASLQVFQLAKQQLLGREWGRVSSPHK